MPPSDTTVTTDVASDASAPATTPAPAPEVTSAPAEASTTTTTTQTEAPAKAPTSMLDAVRSVLKEPAEDAPQPVQKEPAQSEPDRSTDVTTTADQTSPSEPDLTETDFADVDKPSVRKRVNQLLAQRTSAREEAGRLREPATQWNTHVEFLRGNGITPDQAQQLYGVGALLARGDYVNFLAAVEPYVAAVRTAMGETLSEDLQRQVEEGVLMPEHAQEISRARADAFNANLRLTATQHQQVAANEDANRLAVQNAMSDWEKNISSRDPEYERKREAVGQAALAMTAQRGLPPDAATARQWANEAYGQVNRWFASAQPPRPATPLRPNGHASAPSSNARPEPKSLLEAVRFAIADTRAKAAR